MNRNKQLRVAPWAVLASLVCAILLVFTGGSAIADTTYFGSDETEAASIEGFADSELRIGGCSCNTETVSGVRCLAPAGADRSRARVVPQPGGRGEPGVAERSGSGPALRSRW